MGDERPVRVLWLIKGLGPGGAEQLLVNHARARDRERFTYEVAYLVPQKDHHVAALDAEGVAVTSWPSARRADLAWARRLRARLRADPVDVVHSHSPLVAAVARLVVRTLPRDARPAHVATEHNRWPRHRAPTRVANAVTFPLDRAHVAVAEEVRATIPRALRRDVEVIVHGVDLDHVRAQRAERAAVRAELGLADDQVVVGIVANLRREKGYDVLLEAAARALADPAGDHLVYVAVGQGPLEEEVRAQHRALGLGDRVRLLGYRPDAVRVMAAFDVFTLSSRHEGLPVALMDAMALGLPTVATDVGGIGEVVDDGVEGLLVPPDDPAALARAHLDLAADPDRRRRMGEAAERRSELFDVTRAVRRLEEIYVRVASRRA